MAARAFSARCGVEAGRPRASARGESRRGDSRAHGSARALERGLSMPSSTTTSSSSSASAANLQLRISKFLKPVSSDLPPRMYSRALALCREQDYNRAFAVFERVVCLSPEFSKAWVSWAQAEKRSDPKAAVAVLQAGLALNRRAPPSARAPLAQAWGLAELQQGNSRAAIALLSRAVEADPRRCAPVLRWAPVVEAAARAERERSERRSKGSPSTTTAASAPSPAAPPAPSSA